jgi:electron-transferring-flavoprotein dehydrogenase
MAMKSGMVAAESILGALHDYGTECGTYTGALKASWLWPELKAVRNIRPGFRFGLLAGLGIAALETITRGKLPYTLKHHADHAQTGKAKDYAPIAYPKPDGVITFDRLTSVQLSNTNHEEDQPSHLKLRDPSIPIGVNLPEFAEPAQRYCPAGVYEIVEDDTGTKTFQINAQNCVHCKTCDIKDPSQNIDWTTPQGGGGPNYPNM